MSLAATNDLPRTQLEGMSHSCQHELLSRMHSKSTSIYLLYWYKRDHRSHLRPRLICSCFRSHWHQPVQSSQLSLSVRPRSLKGQGMQSWGKRESCIDSSKTANKNHEQYLRMCPRQRFTAHEKGLNEDAKHDARWKRQAEFSQIEERKNTKKKYRQCRTLISGSCNNNPERKLDPTPFTLGSQNCFGDAASYSMSQHPAPPRPL